MCYLSGKYVFQLMVEMIYILNKDIKHSHDLCIILWVVKLDHHVEEGILKFSLPKLVFCMAGEHRTKQAQASPPKIIYHPLPIFYCQYLWLWSITINPVARTRNLLIYSMDQNLILTWRWCPIYWHKYLSRMMYMWCNDFISAFYAFVRPSTFFSLFTIEMAEHKNKSTLTLKQLPP